jgi:hypothetical protein
MNENTKLIKLSLAEKKAVRNHELIKAAIENPILELVTGFVLVDYLRHHGIDYSRSVSENKGSFLGLTFWDTKTTTQTGYPLLGDTAANWLQVGIILSVAAQQMKNNPAAERLAGQGINAVGQIGAAGVNAIGGALKGLGGAASTALMSGLI